MSVYIKGMEMPTNCMLCPFCVEEADPANGEMCMVTGTLMPPCTRERLNNCPLIPVHAHGRLIDADALDADLEWQDIHTGEWDAVGFSIEEIENAPTIIPADANEEKGETK